MHETIHMGGEIILELTLNEYMKIYENRKNKVFL